MTDEGRLIKPKSIAKPALPLYLFEQFHEELKLMLGEIETEELFFSMLNIFKLH